MLNQLKTTATDFSRVFLNFLYPRRCQICDSGLNYQNGSSLCAGCLAKISFNNPPFCKKCGRPQLKETAGCSECHDRNFYFKRAHSACVYEGVIKECLHKFKYESKLQLSFDLSRILIDFVNKHSRDIKTIDMVVPVPLHGTKQRERQFNQAHILARHLARRFNLPINSNSLIKTKNTPSQIGLSRNERIKNLSGVFKVKNNSLLYSKNILLLDDVFTTGTTADECAKVLTQAGAKNIFVLTVARGI